MADRLGPAGPPGRLSPQAWLGLYLAAVVAITFVHQPLALAVLLGLALLGARRRAGPLLRKALLAVAAFNLTVSLGYAVVASWQGSFSSHYLLLVNLRVLLLVFLGFWLVDRVNLLAALAGRPVLRLVSTLAISQIKTFERILRDFGMAFRSRNLEPPRMRARAGHAAAQARTLLDKSVASASEAALAMRSRGSFDD